MAVFSPDSREPVTITVSLIGAPDSLIDFSAPSRRGCRFAEPALAVKMTTSPAGTAATIRLPISSPASFRSWPM